MNSTNFLFSAICRVFKDYLENEYCGLLVGQGVSRFLGQISFLYNVFEYGKTYIFSWLCTNYYVCLGYQSCRFWMKLHVKCNELNVKFLFTKP